MTPLPEKAG